MTFAIPFEHSIHNYLLRYFLAEHGLDPDKDVKLRLTTPPDMIANLKAGNIDGFLVLSRSISVRFGIRRAISIP